ASVTRSMSPFFSICMASPTRAICTSPARITASMAVARYSGGIRSGTGSELLDHAYFHPAFRPAAHDDIVHEAAHEEDAASARLQDVLGGQGIGDFFGLEPFTLVDDADDELGGSDDGGDRELDHHELAVVFPVPMLDGIDDRLAHGHADPVDGVLVEPGEHREPVAGRLDHVEQFEVAGDFQPDGTAANRHQREPPAARRARGAGNVDNRTVSGCTGSISNTKPNSASTRML